MKIYNSLTGKKEILETLVKSKLTQLKDEKNS